MSRNIKEIGKELMGKSINSYHRKTGLTQLEKNNEMQDGILNGILSQVDDAYIEKTEQSNVIHLDGSGDGVVVVDSIEGNTMVNIVSSETKKLITKSTSGWVQDRSYKKSEMIKPNTKYTIICQVFKNTCSTNFSLGGDTSGDHNQILGTGYQHFAPKEIGTKISVVISNSNISTSNTSIMPQIGNNGKDGVYDIGEEVEYRFMLLEGDYSNQEVNFFEGLQSSFEEKVNEEGKYEIEILSQNKNLIDKEYFAEQLVKHTNVTREHFNGRDCIKIDGVIDHIKVQFGTNDNKIKTLRMSAYTNLDSAVSICHYGRYLAPSFNGWSDQWGTETYNYVSIYNYENRIVYIDLDSIQLEYGDTYTGYIPRKSNKIKLLLNEPLRSVSNGVKDKLCIKNKKLVIERNTLQLLINGTEDFHLSKDNSYNSNYHWFAFRLPSECKIVDNAGISKVLISDKFNVLSNTSTDFSKDEEFITLVTGNKSLYFNVKKAKYPALQDFKNYLSSNNVNIVSEITEPIYEEVLNEYGEPILLEGYENGTLYIDSTIVPTTTVRYTPKMESFNTIKEVSSNNVMLTNDINDTIVPYMMEVDLMIMEKEMSLFNSLNKNIRIMEALDMTSMQKRTGEMLERLIKGKTLTEKECKTRVTVYLNAGKITDEQAEELMLLISEIYA